MNKNTFKKGNWLVLLSAISCFVSLLIFFVFIYQTNSVSTTNQKDFFTFEQLNVIINKERVMTDLPPLKLSDKLNTAAKNKALDMSAKQYFSHISPVDGKKWSDFIKESNYNYEEAGENLANGFNNPVEMVASWMKSPSHKENILNKDVDETGIGYSYGKLGGVPTIFVVQVFGIQEKSI
jgi:uncharacterized protein YkwD